MPITSVTENPMLLRALGYLGVLCVSFTVTLWSIDWYHDRHSPLLGTAVTYSIAAEKQPEVCATAKSTIVFKGRICAVNGEDLSVDWNSMANVTNSQPSCGNQPIVRWPRKENDPAYNSLFFGSCGVRPQYFSTMPSVFRADALRASND